MSIHAVLEADQLSVGYHGSPVVRSLDLKLNAGELVCLLGSNGAGKSTTLLALAGELRAIEGRVLVDGATPANSLHGRARQGIVLIPEERSVIPSLSVRDNLRLGPGPVSEAIRIFPQLEPLMSRKGGLLSGGEQQMLALARALSSRPKAVLVDEVSMGLAPMAVQSIMAALRSAVDDWGLAALVVDQHLQTALKWADRGYVLSRGQLAMSGTSQELTNRRQDVLASYLSGTAAQG